MFPRSTSWLTTVVAAVLLGLAPSATAQSAERGPEGLRLPSLVDVAAPVHQADFAPSRPKAMLPLYSTLLALQAADAALTVRGLDAGARELNPLMRNGTTMTVTKVATMATTVFVAEKMWKRNKPAAIAALIAANAVTGLIVARNVQVVNAARR